MKCGFNASLYAEKNGRWAGGQNEADGKMREKMRRADWIRKKKKYEFEWIEKKVSAHNRRNIGINKK